MDQACTIDNTAKLQNTYQTTENKGKNANDGAGTLAQNVFAIG
jgi:hypothetical protein